MKQALIDRRTDRPFRDFGYSPSWLEDEARSQNWLAGQRYRRGKWQLLAIGVTLLVVAALMLGFIMGERFSKQVQEYTQRP